MKKMAVSRFITFFLLSSSFPHVIRQSKARAVALLLVSYHFNKRKSEVHFERMVSGGRSMEQNPVYD